MRFAKAQEKKMGKPEAPVVVKPRGPQKSPISKGWIGTSFYTTQSNPTQPNPRLERDWRGDGGKKMVLLTLTLCVQFSSPSCSAEVCYSRC